LSRRPAARLVVCFVVLGAVAGLLAGYSAYAMWPSHPPAEKTDRLAVSPAQTPPQAHIPGHAEPRIQASNAAAKTDRLAMIRAAMSPAAPAAGGFMLASAQQGADLGRFTDIVAAASTMADQTPTPDQPPQAGQAPASTAVALAPLPPQKPKRPAPESGDLLGDGQIAGLKSRLRLTNDQMEYWPAVEAALRDVARTQLRATSAKRTRGAKASIDVNSPEVQKLIYAAMPLLMRLREDQKREVRKLARVIGLEQVASQI
jgi:hypothetical protein